MKPSADKVVSAKTGIVILLTVVVFTLDVLTPLGWADWLLYFIPLVATLQSPRERIPYQFAAVLTVLIAVGGYLSPSDIHPRVGLFNRGLGILMMWALTWLIVRQKKDRTLLAGAEAAQTQAETRQEAAVAARELAESSLTGALHRESQSSQELLINSLRLESIFQSAMDAIITIDEGQHVLLFNESAERMFQCPAREAIGQTLDKFIPARFRDAHHLHVKEFGQSGVTSRRMGELGTVTGLLMIPLVRGLLCAYPGCEPLGFGRGTALVGGVAAIGAATGTLLALSWNASRPWYPVTLPRNRFPTVAALVRVRF